MAFVFEWDRTKAEENRLKHRVSFEEALTVFGDPLARIFTDEDHSASEQREIIIGYSERRRLLVISFSARTASIRLISARRATRNERQDFEENVAP
jgi:uncharacterized DUF497 family protein